MTQTLRYKIHEVAPYINWLYFFHAWGFPSRFAAIAKIHGCDSCRASWLASFPLSGLFDCNAESDDIFIDIQDSSITLSFLHQQHEPFLCLSDFIRPKNTNGHHDKIGIFAACADEAIEQHDENDDYRHLLCQTLADRLAEATVERAHEAIRKYYWGYVPEEHLSIDDLHAERFQGIRPAVGYPSLPDQSLNFELDHIIDFASIGIRLTENGAMKPHASVSGLMIAHPEARYFAVGQIGEDQLMDYSRRKGRTPEEMRPFLATNM